MEGINSSNLTTVVWLMGDCDSHETIRVALWTAVDCSCNLNRSKNDTSQHAKNGSLEHGNVLILEVLYSMMRSILIDDDMF